MFASSFLAWMRGEIFPVILALTLLFIGTPAAESATEPRPETAGGAIKHRLLLLDESRSQLLCVDQLAPEKNWQCKIAGGPAWGLQLTGNGNVLTAVPKLGGFREYNLESRKEVRAAFDAKRFAGAICATRLPDGHTVLGCERRGGVRIFLLDPKDKEVASWHFPEIKSIRQIRRTVRNTLLFGSGSDWIYEVSMEGKILRKARLAGAKYVYQVVELPNGNLLAAAGYGAFLAELTWDGKIVRKLGGLPAPKGLTYIFMSQFQVLKNGHILVATWTGHASGDSKKGQQLVEFDATGKVVWSWHDPALAGSIHSVIVLDDLDASQFDEDAARLKN
ncbi:MAG: hypothetical protein LBD14_07090 [Puniceicoccales bacterium]|jgi:outer membrane protein assembly factor BamB|nr:hypothetical protein [Puniceicoccales bacterium]